MFRIALIIAALVSGHHKVHVTHADGRGYMTTQLACPASDGVPLHGAPTKIVCIDGHLVLKSSFVRTRVAMRDGELLTVRRAIVYNSAGRLEGWVDWTRGARAIGHVLLKDGPTEDWQGR